MAKTFTSRVSVDQKTKTALIEDLNTTLATTIDLQMQVKQAHWNVKGPQFVSRHELFEAVASRLRSSADMIAERAATLGGYAGGTVRMSAEASKLPEYELNAVDGRHHIKTLVDRFATYTELLRDSIEKAEAHKEPATIDLYTEVLRTTELDMWFLESHINV